jgi:hypothetical protein
MLNLTLLPRLASVKKATSTGRISASHVKTPTAQSVIKEFAANARKEWNLWMESASVSREATSRMEFVYPAILCARNATL